ncbi:phosphoribosyltransferase [Pseudoalteromonas sp. 20-92]|uniref:phosphoribosyltransferase n=1 Tax=Pseudoalteromonas sp. 20-92 TaxID=2969394 RepID=UPI0027B75996|nr:hypothetical protein [Pseudoalteromonas sp. 20-92]MDQ2045100.1 phosphoribosyltransferase [Pseudoalteromonas sp. 20-92]
MGIDICRAHKVSLNETHEQRLVTSIERNPVESLKENLLVKCVYRRTKYGDYQRDGNPFIYALKRKSPYSITNSELFRFRPSFKEILFKMCQDIDVDFVLGVPSSHQIVSHFGNRVARQIRAVYIDDYFSKQTVGDVLSTFSLTSVNDKHKKAVKKVLSTYKKLDANEEVSLKKIENKIRHYFEPVKINPSYSGVNIDGNILIVDDLLSTGTTLLSSARILSSRGINIAGGFCLLSDLTTRK